MGSEIEETVELEYYHLTKKKREEIGIKVQRMQFIKILEFIDNHDPEYVLVLSGDHIYK